MNLSEFIKETLSEVAKGAMKADVMYREMGRGCVNPRGKFHFEGIASMSSGEGRHLHSVPVTSVNFNLKVELEERNEINGGIGGVLKVISANLGASKGKNETSVQEISFSVPVVLPCMDDKQNHTPSEH